MRLVPPLNLPLSEWPSKLLTLLPPWWWMCCHHSKRRENRSWATSFRGWFWIHASAPQTGSALLATMKLVEDIVRAIPLGRGRKPPTAEILNANAGHIVGRARLALCERNTPAVCLRDPWAVEGDFGFVLEQMEPLNVSIPWKGAQGLVNADPLDVATVAHITAQGGAFVRGDNASTRSLAHRLEQTTDEVDAILARLVADKQLRHENGAHFVRSYPAKLSAAYKAGERPVAVTGETSQQLLIW